MGPTSRHRIEWLTAMLAVLTAWIWTMRAVEAMTMSREPSAKAIVACVAFVCVGLALGAVLWAFPAYRRMQSASGSPDGADRRPWSCCCPASSALASALRRSSIARRRSTSGGCWRSLHW